MDRKIIGLGKYSLVVAIPQVLLKHLGWRKGQKVSVSADGKTLKIKDARSR